MSAPLDISEHLFIAIDHVGIAVPDLDEAIEFYRDAFGMRVACSSSWSSRQSGARHPPAPGPAPRR